jgi:hypothetical protein
MQKDMKIIPKSKKCTFYLQKFFFVILWNWDANRNGSKSFIKESHQKLVFFCLLRKRE